MKRVAVIVGVVFLTLGAALIFWKLRAIVALLAVSMAVAGAARPVMLALSSWGLPRRTALALTYAFGLLLVGSLGTAIGGTCLDELDRVTDRLVPGYERLIESWLRGPEVERSVVKMLPSPKAVAGAFGRLAPTSVLAGALDMLTLAATGILAIIAVIVFSIYWAAGREVIEGFWLSLVPARGRPIVRQLWLDLETGVGTYLLSEGTKSYLTVMVLVLAFDLLRMPYVALPALFVGVVRLVPLLGAALAVAGAAAAGLAAGPEWSVVAAAVTLLVLLALDGLVARRFLHLRQFNPVLVLLAALALWDVWGFWGLVVAPPLAAAVQIAYESLASADRRSAVSALRIEEVETRLDDLRQRMQSDTDVPPETWGLFSRLEVLAIEARRAHDVHAHERRIRHTGERPEAA